MPRTLSEMRYRAIEMYRLLIAWFTFRPSPLRADSTVCRALVASALLITLAVPVQAQCPEGWLPNPGVPGTNWTVHAVTTLPDGDVIVGGEFTTAGGAPANRIARYDRVAGIWSALGAGLSGEVHAVAVLPCGDVIAGGGFTTAGTVTANSIARYSFSTGLWSAMGSGVEGVVNALAVLPDGDIIVGGEFTVAGSVVANSIARYNPGISAWSALGTGLNGVNPTVHALAVLPGGDLFVGGQFYWAGGVATGCIARYDTTSEVWSALGSGITSDDIMVRVYALAVGTAGDVYVGGEFFDAGGVSVSRAARYSSTSGNWSALGLTGFDGPVQALTVLPGGDVVAAGAFEFAAGAPANGIAKCNLTTGVWSALGAGTNGGVFAMSVLPVGDLVAGGYFTVAGEHPSAYFAQYSFGGIAPSITTDPTPLSTCPSGSAEFSVVASGTGPFIYQWRENTLAIDTLANPSAATATLMLAPLTGADAASYDCIVTNSCGSATSSAATLSVCASDFNCNTFIEDADFAIFVIAYNILDCADPSMPQGCPADLNTDAVVDDADFVAFVAAYNARACP